MTTQGLTRVGRADEVPSLEGRSVIVEGRRIAVFRTEDGWRAVDGVCPHEGGPLADGIVADRCVTCPLHGWRFDLDTGEAVGGDARVAVYEVLEQADELWLRLPPSGLADAA
jgi:nitrite reductase [NAD(P)H] small subunit